jgi:hypothetical protein
LAGLIVFRAATGEDDRGAGEIVGKGCRVIMAVGLSAQVIVGSGEVRDAFCMRCRLVAAECQLFK